MTREYNIDKVINDMDFTSNSFVDCGNGLMLTNKEIEVLKRYEINYKSCSSLKEIIYKIEDILNESFDIDDSELEAISFSISERDYYLNTNKQNRFIVLLHIKVLWTILYEYDIMVYSEVGRLL